MPPGTRSGVRGTSRRRRTARPRAVGVTSTGPRADREAERRRCARGGIPLHLLADRGASSIALFSDPERDDHREHLTRPLGRPLPFPGPFAFDLETADFLRPAARYHGQHGRRAGRTAAWRFS
ncbi:hypothetical protein GCM10020295_59450 [Streptomyces cinereospinus]